MVRRLKRDLRALGAESFPERILVKHELEHTNDTALALRSDEKRSDAKRESLDLGVRRGPRSPARGATGPLHGAVCAQERPRSPSVHSPPAAPPLEPRGLREEPRDARRQHRVEGRCRFARREGQTRCGSARALRRSRRPGDPRSHRRSPASRRRRQARQRERAAPDAHRRSRRAPERPPQPRPSAPAVSRTRRCEPSKPGCDSTAALP
jgi:hypothetical protein